MASRVQHDNCHKDWKEGKILEMLRKENGAIIHEWLDIVDDTKAACSCFSQNQDLIRRRPKGYGIWSMSTKNIGISYEIRLLDYNFLHIIRLFLWCSMFPMQSLTLVSKILIKLW